MQPVYLVVLVACILAYCAESYELRRGDKFYLLRNVLHRLAEDVPGINYEQAFDDLEDERRGEYDPYAISRPSTLDDMEAPWGEDNINDLVEGENPEATMLKRAPPSGFSAVRGKRQLFAGSDKRVPSPNEFFGARGKKSDTMPGKRLPSRNEFFGVRGKKAGFWGHWNNRQVREGVKRIPQADRFYGARGKKSGSWLDGSDENKRVMASQQFFGARGKKSADEEYAFNHINSLNGHYDKRLQPNQFFGARGKKSSQDDAIKRFSSHEFFGVRGKKSEEFAVEGVGAHADDEDFEKRLSQDQFFGARGKKSDYQEKRVPLDQFFGARGKKSSDLDKRVPLDQFFGARGKKSDNEKRLSQDQFFGARGKKSEFDDELVGDNVKRLSQNQFFGARGKKSSEFGLKNEAAVARHEKELKENLLRLSESLGRKIHTSATGGQQQPEEDNDE